MTLRRHARRILNTRPLNDSAELTETLEALGCEVLSEPLLKIQFHDVQHPDMSKIQALVFTSRNGVRAFIRGSSLRETPVYAVGDGTASFAREVGFAAVESGGGNIESLVALIDRKADPDSGALLHIAGSVTAGDLSGELLGHGYSVERLVMYDAQISSALSTRTINALRNGEVDDVVFFSPRTARVFVELVTRYDVQALFDRIDALCLSTAVAETISVLRWRKIKIATTPKLIDLVKLIQDDIGTGAENDE